MQDSHTSDHIHSVAETIAFLSQDTTLLPGTVILTGTPSGIGMFRTPPRYLAPGDVVSATIETIGTLSNPVIDAPRRTMAATASTAAATAQTAAHPTGRVLRAMSSMARRSMSTQASAEALPLSAIPGPRSAAEMNELNSSLGGDQHAIYAEMHRRYGDIMLMGRDVFGTDVVTLFHPTHIERVMRHEGPLPRGLGQALLPFAHFYRDHAPKGLNLGRISGKDWLSLRKAMNQPMMSPKAAQSYLPHLNRVMPACSEHLAAHGDKIDDYAARMTFEMICSVLLDHRPGIVSGTASELDQRFVETSKRVFPLMAELMSPDEMPSFVRGESALYREQFEPTMLEIMEMGKEYIADLRQRLQDAAVRLRPVLRRSHDYKDPFPPCR